MLTRRAWLRLGLLAFLLATFLGPIGAGAGNSVSCDDFANPDAAQHLLDIDDTYAGDLDPDGDGIACNEDGDQDEDSGSSSEYLDTVATEVVTIQASFETFLDLLAEPYEEMTIDERTEHTDDLDDIAAIWASYPDDAPAPEAPAEFADIDDMYREWIDWVGTAGESWQAFRVADQEGTDDEIQEAIDAFSEAQATARELAANLFDLVEDEGGVAQDAPADDAGEESGSALTPDDYLAAVDDHFNLLVDSFQDFTDLVDSGDITEDDRDTLWAIYDTWAEAADVAAGIEPPAGYEDIHAAYLDVANGFTELYNRYSAWLETESGTDEDDEALAAYEEQVDILNDLCIELDRMLTDAA
jgi:hypothetical protein